MSKLNEIKASPKAGSENLTEEGQIIEYNLSDFCRVKKYMSKNKSNDFLNNREE